MDPVTNSIMAMIDAWEPAPIEFFLFKVNPQVRIANETAYKPERFSIGPYHYGKGSMDNQKYRYIWQLLRRKNEHNVNNYVVAMRKLVDKARHCYAEPISLQTDSFLMMIVIDGLFIAELFLKNEMRNLIDEFDQILKDKWVRVTLERDLLLYENQIPLFVIKKLFKMILIPTQQFKFIDLALKFFRLGRNHESTFGNSINDAEHLLGLVHMNICPSFIRLEHNSQNWKSIPCATQLREARVKFTTTLERNMFDIRFSNGVMEIPTLRIDDQTECQLRNLMAYEQYGHDNHPKYVTDYVIFIFHLIRSPVDVELLRRKGILENWVSDDEAVSSMFNKIGHFITPSDESFYCSEVFDNVNKYCSRRRNVWMEKLERNYLSSPWAMISILAATMLLLLTITQTIFSILSYTSA